MSCSKLLLVFLLAGLLPLSAQAEVLRLEIEFEEPARLSTPVGDVLEIPGTSLMGRPGEPLLPQKTFTLVLPYGHLPDTLRVEAIDAQSLAGSFDIAPAQHPAPLSSRRLPVYTPPDPDVYSSDQMHPGAWALLGAVQYQRGYAVVPVTVYPLSYRPLSRRTQRLVSATLALTTRPGGAVSWTYRAHPQDARDARQRFDHTQHLSGYPKSPSRGPTRLEPGQYDYLIVSPDAFIGLGGADSLEALRDARESSGLTANIVSLEWIQANYEGFRPDGGQDDATRIRDFLTDAYQEWTSSYVLLVGDADAGDSGGESGDDLLQVRKFYVDPGNPEVQADHIPSDMYYGCLDGSFDHDADGTYGEYNDGPDGGEVDLLAELYVGRAPVDSESEIRNFVAKNLAYQAAVGTWLKEVWMVGELLWDDPTEVWAGDAMDEIIEGSNAGGFTTLGFSSFPFFTTNTLYDRDLAPVYWGAADLMAILNESPHVVNHLGHSNVPYNMRLDNQDADALVNPHPFIHYSQGCLNGSFDNRLAMEEGGWVYDQDCIAEHFVCGQYGAVATVSNSRYGWGSFMTDGPSQRFNRQFWDAFFAEGMATLGEALADSKADNAAGFQDPYNRWAGFESNLLGDPALALKKNVNTTDPLLGVYPPQLDFVSKAGAGNPETQLLRVRNDGVGTLSFTALSDQPWVTLTPDSGQAPVDIQVAIDPSGLQPGNHQAQITFESLEAPNSPMQITIQYLLVEVPQIRVLPIDQAPLVDGVIDPGEYDNALSLPIDPGGSGQVTLYLARAGSILHLAVNDLSDVTESEMDRMRFYFDRDLDELWPTSAGSEGAYMIVSRNGTMLLFMPVFNDGSGAQFDWQFMEMNPAGVTGVVGFNDNHRVYEMSIDLEQSRLNVGPTGSFGMYMWTENSAQMGEGEATGSWPPVVPEVDDQVYFGRVDLLPEGPYLDVSPASLHFEAIRDQAAPDPASLNLVDLQGGSLAFTVDVSESWLLVGPVSGQTPAEVSASVDHAGLAAGSYQAEIVIEASAAGNSPITVPATLEVLPQPGRLTVDHFRLELSVVQGEADATLELSVGNLGDLEMDAAITTSHIWLAADPVEFSVQSGESRSVTLTVGLADLGPGSYQAEIRVDAPGAQDSPVTVPLQLEVHRFNSAPPAPRLLSPADGSEVSGEFGLTAARVTDPQGDPVTYLFELLQDSQVVDSSSKDVDSDFMVWQPAIQLQVGQTYSWRVQAQDDLGASAVSETWSFTVVAEPDEGCGCAQGNNRSSLLLLMLIGLLLVRRR